MEWICNSDAGLSRASSASSRAYAITNACPLTLIRAMLRFRFGARHQINSDWSDSCGFEALGRGQYPIKRRRSVSVSHESKAAISTRTRQVLFVRSRHLDRAVSKSCFWRRAPLSRRVFLHRLRHGDAAKPHHATVRARLPTLAAAISQVASCGVAHPDRRV